MAYPGNHPPIVDPALFDAVQKKLADNRRTHRDRPLRSATMALKGKLFDTDGEPMTPSFTHKGERIYRYYVSAPLMQRRPLRGS